MNAAIYDTKKLIAHDVDFGSVLVNEKESKDLYLKNDSISSVKNVKFKLQNNSKFSIKNPEHCAQFFASCYLTVIFSPTRDLVVLEELEISYELDGKKHKESIQLKGEATAPLPLKVEGQYFGNVVAKNSLPTYVIL